ncbi:hypothetical protein ARSEF1564_009828 [Beauveria bassiana]
MVAPSTQTCILDWLTRRDGAGDSKRLEAEMRDLRELREELRSPRLGGPEVRLAIPTFSGSLFSFSQSLMGSAQSLLAMPESPWYLLGLMREIVLHPRVQVENQDLASNFMSKTRTWYISYLSYIVGKLLKTPSESLSS